MFLFYRGGGALLQHHVAAARGDAARHRQGHGHAHVPPPARGHRRNHAVQLPGHDPALGASVRVKQASNELRIESQRFLLVCVCVCVCVFVCVCVRARR